MRTSPLIKIFMIQTHETRYKKNISKTDNYLKTFILSIAQTSGLFSNLLSVNKSKTIMCNPNSKPL